MLGRINPADNSTIDIPVEGAIGPYRGIAIGESAVWVPDIGSKTIFKVDPQANRVVMRTAADLFDSEVSIGVGAGAVWVVTMAGKNVTSKDYDRELSRFNASTGVLEATLQFPARGAAAIFDYGWFGSLGSTRMNSIAWTRRPIVSSRQLLCANGRASWHPFGSLIRATARCSGLTGEAMR
ncbi:hypothetical protein SAMN05216228_106918 [Rhizobium tibeticum]|uniref:Uncharacterized protein n=1 Tax=Rhizobium tibeticum TaxID=501024 RepID=A0A1H8WLM2_9HYPH|nr:hypothetical protein [Rhizobium tibeticum]SEI21263.1 hypothetical protein RTCCBAU85039_6581 [Rhizobium tibeticum]SEP28551.1 hypothetical protein SAMN05216228_106918 [Rhizobium tibeticum]